MAIDKGVTTNQSSKQEQGGKVMSSSSLCAVTCPGATTYSVGRRVQPVRYSDIQKHESVASRTRTKLDPPIDLSSLLFDEALLQLSFFTT